ncbi:hypothetical protein [Aurantimonas coralicida]|uniref:hypothetical protein n=1 Tax=Aurantimonas coralicida TaxID=182270 RepID=UPI0035149A09
MKALKRTGLVPVKFLAASGPYQKDQIAGLDPATVKRLKAGKKPIIKEVAAAKGEATIEIDDDSLQIVADTPGLGGNRHMPPLASDRLPGRDRLREEGDFAGTADPESPDSPKAVEDPDKATVDDPDAHDGEGGEGNGKETPPKPPLPGRKTGK